MQPYVRVIIFIIVSIMSFVSSPVYSGPKQTTGPMKKLSLAFIESKETALGEWVILIYSEAFKRLNMEFEVKTYPGKRASIMADRGQVDGELIRVYSYWNDHPNLLRVEESVLSIKFSAFTTDPSIRLHGWEDLRKNNYKVEYMRGTKHCEEQLPKVVRPDNLSVTNNATSGLKKLIAGRTDVYVNSELFILKTLKKEQFRSVHNIGILEEVPHFLYLHNKHQELVPKFAAVLKSMKDEGLIDEYLSIVLNK